MIAHKGHHASEPHKNPNARTRSDGLVGMDAGKLVRRVAARDRVGVDIVGVVKDGMALTRLG